VFARLANGNMSPVRVIEGQATHLSRTMHGIAYDAVHDEVIVPVHLAGAVLVFRGDAKGEERPVRMIQGPHTQILRPETVTVDVPHGEIIVGEDGGKDILVFSRQAQGDATPLRIIRGVKTGLDEVRGVAVDPARNVIVVSSYSKKGTTGLFVFNRTDEGDVAPKAVIAGPRTGIIRIRQVEVDSAQGEIFAAVKNNTESYRFDALLPSPWNSAELGFIGVWDITDNGDVAPRAILKGPASGMVWPAGVAFNARNHEIYTIDSVRNGMLAYSVPEFFRVNSAERWQPAVH
jgi:DNA-binding beta-propeller fold protein YncE